MNKISTTHNFRCNLNKGTLEVTLEKALMHQDSLGDTFSVSVWRGSSPVSLDGVTVRGYLYLMATQQTVLLSGSATGSSASVTLDSSCYAVPGRAALIIQLQKGTVRHTVLKANFMIDCTCTDTVIDPGSVLPTLPELLAQIAAMEQGTAEAREAAAAADAAREGIQGDLAALSKEIEEHHVYCGITVNTAELREQYNDFNTLPKNTLVAYYMSAFTECANIPDGFTTGAVLTLSTINRSTNYANQLALSNGFMWTRMLFGDTWSKWECCTNREAGKPNYVYVAPNGSDETGDGSAIKPYATIFHANETITDAAPDNRYVIKVADGVYTDLQSRYANTNATTAQGVVCKDYVEYVGNVDNPSACVIQWDGVYGYDAIPAYSGVVEKCPFHIGRNWTLAGLHTAVRGFKIVGKNLRYCMHIDTGGKGKNVEWEVSDCIFEWGGCPDVSDASNVTDIACIGTGSSNFERGTLKRCTLVASDGITKGFENHDTIYYSGYEDSPAFYEGAKITIDSCSFNGLDVIMRSYYSDAEVLTQGYDILHVINTVGVNRLIPSPRNGVTNKWWANIECSSIQTNGFS